MNTTAIDYHREFQSTHVMITHPFSALRNKALNAEAEKHHVREAWQGPHEIVLDLGDRVWIAASYMHEGHPDVHVINPPEEIGGKGYDRHGNCVLSVPAEWCRFIDPVEADSIVEAQAADDRLMDYI